MGLGSSSDSLMANAVGEGAVSRGYAVYFNRTGVAVVTWDPTLQAVYTEAQGWTDPSEMTAVLEACLQALAEHHGSRWLADARNMKVIKQSDRDWIAQTFFPRALTAGLKRVALVIPESGLAMTTLDQVMQRLPAEELAIARFATVEEARSWLTQAPANAINGVKEG
jgi:stage II sporulation SpoAA-like protein